MSLPAILLAAGSSRRLGQPKQLLRIQGETLLDRAIRVAREAGACPIVVVLGAHLDSIVQDAEMHDVERIINTEWDRGIASSIHAGMYAVQQKLPDCNAVLFMVCDQPQLEASHLKALCTLYEQQQEPAIVASAYAGVAGIPAIFPSSQFEALLALTGDAGARYLLRNPSCPLAFVPFEGGEVDIDTPDDLASLNSV